jgi:methionyl-tRNA formyltransferase
MHSNSTKICIAGKNEIAVYGLNLLLKIINHKDLLVVCNSSDEGYDTWQPSLKKVALSNNIKVISLDECYEEKNLIFISLEYDKIVNPKNFNTSKLYNIHFSLLPAYKGMYTSAIPIINGESESGVTLHKIDRGIDTGDIIDKISFPIGYKDNAKDLYYKYLLHSKTLLERNIHSILEDNIHTTKQSHIGSSYYSKKSIDYNNLKINLNSTGEQIYNQIRAYTFPEYQVPKIQNFFVNSCNVLNNKSSLKPGTIIDKSSKEISIASIDYDLNIIRDRTADLYDAIKDKDINLIKDCLKNGANVNVLNNNGWSPLIIGSFNANQEVIEILINGGADINLTNYKGTTPLMYAMSNYEKTGDKKNFELLIKKGADINRKDIHGKTIKDYATDRGLLNLF